MRATLAVNVTFETDIEDLTEFRRVLKKHIDGDSWLSCAYFTSEGEWEVEKIETPWD